MTEALHLFSLFFLLWVVPPLAVYGLALLFFPGLRLKFMSRCPHTEHYFATLLADASAAHHAHETQNSPDPNWIPWYASHMAAHVKADAKRSISFWNPRSAFDSLNTYLRDIRPVQDIPDDPREFFSRLAIPDPRCVIAKLSSLLVTEGFTVYLSHAEIPTNILLGSTANDGSLEANALTFHDLKVVYVKDYSDEDPRHELISDQTRAYLLMHETAHALEGRIPHSLHQSKFIGEAQTELSVYLTFSHLKWDTTVPQMYLSGYLPPDIEKDSPLASQRLATIKRNAEMISTVLYSTVMEGCMLK